MAHFKSPNILNVTLIFGNKSKEAIVSNNLSYTDLVSLIPQQWIKNSVTQMKNEALPKNMILKFRDENNEEIEVKYHI